MLDTIHLKLHNLKKHHYILEWLEAIRGRKSYTMHYQMSDTHLEHDVYINEETGVRKDKTKSVNKYQPSSHYKIIIIIDYKRDCINFNFSVPKYFYGHNVIQAVQSVREKHFIRFKAETLEHNINQCYERFDTYVKAFFHSEFGGLEFDWNDVEISRIDICFNRIFNTRTEALEYLRLMKQIPKKYLRTITPQNFYETGIFYNTQDYALKCYHKGTEYEKNDKKEHYSVNDKHMRKCQKQGVKYEPIFDTNTIQALADRTLRYELSAKRGFMQYLYNQNLCRKNNDEFKKFRQLYKHLMSIEESGKMLEVDFSNELLIHPKTDFYLKSPLTMKRVHFIEWLLHNYFPKLQTEPTAHTYRKAFVNFHKDMSKFMSTPRNFFLSIPASAVQTFKTDYTTNQNVFQTMRNVPITKDLIKSLCAKLNEFILDVQPKAKDTFTNYSNRIDSIHAEITKFNAEATRKNKQWQNMANELGVLKKQTIKRKASFDKDKLKMMVMSMGTYTMAQLQVIMQLPPRTYYHYKRILKGIGLDKNAVSIDCPPADNLNFKVYHDEMFKNQQLFINNTCYKLFN